MESTTASISPYGQDYVYSPDHQYQKYCNINLLDTATIEKSKERVYKVAAVVAKVVGALLLVGVVSGVAIGMLAIPGVGPALAALVTSLALIGGMGVYGRVFDEGFENKYFGISFGALSWTKKAEQHRKNAELNQSIAKMAQAAKEQNPKLSEGQSNLIGRIWHWEKVANTSNIRMKELKTEIFDLRCQIAKLKEGCTPKELNPLKIKLGVALREHHRMTATDHIAAKVKAAYLRHLIANPSEIHPFDDFGTLETDSYLESTQGQSLKLSSNIFYTKLDQPKKNWTIEELSTMDSGAIAQEIFFKTIKVA